MKKVAEILEEMKKKNPVFSRLPDFDMDGLWEKSMDDTIKKVCSPEKFDAGCLYLTVRDSVWLAELSLLKNEIIVRLNTELDKDVVKDIKFKAGTPKKKTKSDKFRLKEYPLPDELEKELEIVLKKIEDKELRNIIEGIFRKSYSLSLQRNDL